MSHWEQVKAHEVCAGDTVDWETSAFIVDKVGYNPDPDKPEVYIGLKDTGVYITLDPNALVYVIRA